VEKNRHLLGATSPEPPDGAVTCLPQHRFQPGSRLDRKLEANRAERRRLADLYQSGLLELGEVQRRARDVDVRHQSLTEQRGGLFAQHHELVTDNRLRQRVFDFAHRAAAGIDKLSFPQRQQLLRFVVEQVRVTGWQVEIQLRIPLDDNRDGPGGGDSRPPASDGGPDGSRPPTHRRHGAYPVSSKDGSRSLRGDREAVALMWNST
jgi:hypothetical protein